MGIWIEPTDTEKNFYHICKQSGTHKWCKLSGKIYFNPSDKFLKINNRYGILDSLTQQTKFHNRNLVLLAAHEKKIRRQMPESRPEKETKSSLLFRPQFCAAELGVRGLL